MRYCLSCEGRFRRDAAVLERFYSEALGFTVSDRIQLDAFGPGGVDDLHALGDLGASWIPVVYAACEAQERVRDMNEDNWLRERFSEIRSGLAAVQDVQRAYDDAIPIIDDNPTNSVRSIVLQATSALGRLATLADSLDRDAYAEADDEMLRRAVADVGPMVADILMQTARLATLAGEDLGEWYEARVRFNAMRFAPDSSLAAVSRLRE